MTNKQLIELLQKFPEDLLVVCYEDGWDEYVSVVPPFITSVSKKDSKYEETFSSPRKEEEKISVLCLTKDTI